VNIVETHGLGRRFGHAWALRDCTVAIPAGRLVALIGPNGAGKSTLLNLVVGLITPTAGSVTVLGGHSAGSPQARDGIAFVAQDMSLYRHLSVSDMLHLSRNLNLHFDMGYARLRLGEFGIAARMRTGKLSGGQQAQLALTLALARHPRLLVLDEPTASLDPVARHDFMATVMAAMADDGVSVILSSHLLAEVSRVADHLTLISGGRVRLDGPVDDLLEMHRLATGPSDHPPEGAEVIESSPAGARTHWLVRLAATAGPIDDRWESRPVGVEELAMAYLREGVAGRAPSLTGAAR
jgi:ABC-2 type transport system ATP-binding protein